MKSAAVAVIRGYQNGPIEGQVKFEEIPREGVRVTGLIKGASPGEHGLHIHEWGDLTRGCDSMGSHYNPFNTRHGARENFGRHVGDLGNVTFDQSGVARFDFMDYMIGLTGAYSVVGRGLVLHEHRDDLGLGHNEESLKTGNAGKRIACGIIGWREVNRQ